MTPMRLVLLQSSQYVPAHGGANKSNRLLLEALAGRRHTCHVVALGATASDPASYEQFLGELGARGIVRQTSPVTDVFHWNGVSVRAARTLADLRPAVIEESRTIDPTWILVSSEDPGQHLLEAAFAWKPDRVVCLARTTLALPFGPDAAIVNGARTQLFAKAAAIVAVSEYLKGYIARWARCSADCLPISLHGSGPFPDFGDPSRDFITLINPCAYKGIDILLELADRFPSVAFAAVTSWGTTTHDCARLNGRRNITVLPPVDDIDQIFARTRVLLVPSLWAEAKSRVITEAMLRGIPVLASDIGGNREAKLGVDYTLPVRPITGYRNSLDERRLPVADVPAQDIEPWAAALHELIASPARYREVSRASRLAAQEFISTHTIDRLETYLQSLQSKASTSHAPPIATASPMMPPPDLETVIETLPPERRQLLLKRLLERCAKSSAPLTVSAGPAVAPPLSPAQEGLWFLHQVDPDSSEYNTKQAFRLLGTFRLDVLERSLIDIVRRHAVLRTSFPNEDGRPRTRLHAPESFQLSMVDLTEYPASRRAAAIEAMALTEIRRPFRLQHTPPLRVLLIRADEFDHVLVIVAHHIITDAWSFAVFTRELGEAYDARLLGRVPVWPELPVQYGDYARWHRGLLQEGALEGQMAYWRRQLGRGVPSLRFPVSQMPDRVPSGEGMAHRFTVSAPLSARLADLARREGVSLYMLLLAAYQLLLHIWTGQSDFAIACPIAHRNRTELEPLIGFFINTLVIRSDVDGDLSGQALLQRVRNTTLAAYANQDVPFEQLVRELQPRREPGQTPLCQVLFVLQNVPAVTVRVPGVEIAPFDLESRTTRFALELILTEDEGVIAGRLVYSTALFRSSAIVDLARDYVSVLEELLRDPALTSAAIGQRLRDAGVARREALEHALRQDAVKRLEAAKRRAVSVSV
jgi:glycosyltransferase involved in cell wall biosynthesis